MKSKENRRYNMSVGTADDYEELIAEVDFRGKAGIIISQEKKEGVFEISLHSFKNNAGDDFDYCRNVNAVKIPLDEFLEAINRCTSELHRLQRG